MKPILALAYGNPSRGDDALGPELMARMQQVDFPAVEWITDFQLQIEHTLDMLNCDMVLFIDASESATEPFEFTSLQAEADQSFSSHALSPQALIAVFQQVHCSPAPDSFLLAIPGYSFELGDELTSAAADNLRNASEFCRSLMSEPDKQLWYSQLHGY